QAEEARSEERTNSLSQLTRPLSSTTVGRMLRSSMEVEIEPPRLGAAHRCPCWNLDVLYNRRIYTQIEERSTNLSYLRRAGQVRASRHPRAHECWPSDSQGAGQEGRQAQNARPERPRRS